MGDDELEELLRQLRSASAEEVEEAFAGLMRRFYHLVSRWIPLSVPSAIRSELIQEVFLRVYRHRGDPPVRDYTAWLHRVTDNVYLSWRERERRQKRRGVEVPLRGSDGDRSGNPESVLASSEPGPIRAVLAREQVEFLKGAISGLPAQRRRVLLLFLRGLTAQEIGRLLKIAEGTVKAHVHAARRQLAEELAVKFGEPGPDDREER